MGNRRGQAVWRKAWKSLASVFVCGVKADDKKSRKWKAMEDDAKKRVIARNDMILDAFNRLDFDAAVSIYTEDAQILPDGEMPSSGRAAIKASFEKSIPPIIDLIATECFYFELITEDTAYSTDFIKSVDKEGKTRFILKDALLWKKINGEWYLHRDMWNSCSPP